MGVFRKYLWLDDSGLGLEKQTRLRTNDLNEALKEDLWGMRFDHIAAGLQLFTEELLAAWVGNAVRTTGVRKVLAAGGVFMNVKANKRIASLPEVKRRTGLSYPAASAGMAVLEQLDIASEITGRRRDRLFIYNRYLAILGEGTEL